MTRIIVSRFLSLVGPSLAALAICVAPAQAALDTVFVSGKGTDTASCGAVASPCRTFQKAHDNTAPGGTIIVRDSGDYGPVHITKSISIINDGAGTASVRAHGTNGITIDSLGPADDVHLRGLAITGSADSSCCNGIDARFFTGSLTIVNSVVRSGFGVGISVIGLNGAPPRLSISRTIVEGDGFGMELVNVLGIVDHVVANRNSSIGVALEGGSTKGTVADSIVSNNVNAGLAVSTGASVTARDVTASYNSDKGFLFQGGPSRFAHSVATGSDFGVFNSSSTVESFGDNDLRGNGAPVFGSLTLVADQ